MNHKLRKNISNGINYFILIVLSIIWIIPVLWIVLQSFDDRLGAFVPYFFPKNWTFNNYYQLFFEINDTIKFAKWFGNTLIVAIATSIISTIVVLSVSYAFSRLRFKGRGFLMRMLMVIGMFPGFLSTLLVYQILDSLGIRGSLFSLVLVYSSGAAMGYFISKGYFDTVPKDIEEAAKIDGANDFQIFTHVMLPLSKPIVIYTILTAFIGPWGDYILNSVLMRGNVDSYNTALGLFTLTSNENISTYFTRFAAGSVIVALPITLLFMWLQKYYVEGVTGGSVK